jgi:protein-S-isoprenylcysteine O-methyltransferase Ste14
MERKITTKASIRSLVGAIVFGALPFLSAGTLHYWEGWLFIAVFSIATTLHTLYLMKNDPALLERRMRAGPAAETRPAQRIIMWGVMLGFVLMMIVPGLDHRFGWSHLPAPVVLAGDLMMALSFVAFYVVCRENSFASATIELAEGQKVISTGPYGLVRHPMYSGGMLLLIGMPLALGSLWGLVPLVVLSPILMWRIFDEEKFLHANLAGYTEYCRNVRYRLIPGIY